MKKNITNNLLVIILPISILFTLGIATAQSLPKVQEVSVRAPSDLKIDGKLTEWNNVFQAYNPASRIFYTISNDDKKIYLTVYTADLHAIAKINNVGINFTISNSTKKNNNEKAKDINNISILFPIKTSRIASKGIPAAILEDAVYSAYSQYKVNTTVYRSQLDSLINIANNEISNSYKGIQVTGIKQINDPILSIYNLMGIQAIAEFDNKMAFTYELAIPLEYIMQPAPNPKTFSYNIKLSEPSRISSNGMPSPTIISSDPNVLFSQSTVDFWGEYTIAP